MKKSIARATPQRPVRVLHVIDSLARGGGAENALRELVLGTQDGDLVHAVAVLFPDGDADDMNRFEGFSEAGIAGFKPDAMLPSRWARVRHVRRAIDVFRPDLVHTSLYEADLAGRVAARLARIPVITSRVSTPYVPAARLGTGASRAKFLAARQLDAFLSRHATTALHAVSEAVADTIVTDFGIDRSRIHVIPRGRDRDRLGRRSPERRERVRRALGVTDRSPVLLAVGRHEPPKAQVFLVEAMASVRERLPDAVLLIAGRDGAATAQITARIEQHYLQDAVRLLGHRDDIADLLTAADVFVCSSLFEGMPGAVLEAMALGATIVGTDVPAVSEALGGGACGLLVPPADGAALAEAITEVVHDPEKARARAMASEHRFETEYRLDKVLDRMRALYHQVLSEQVEAASA